MKKLNIKILVLGSPYVYTEYTSANQRRELLPRLQRGRPGRHGHLMSPANVRKEV